MHPLLGSFLPKAERAFGDYELIGKLATGGMAEIFLARKRVAEADESAAVALAPSDLLVIKKVLPHLLEESRFIAMFRDEARLASQIDHPNVCRVVDSGRVAQSPFIAMEYLHGVAMSRVMERAVRTAQPLDVQLVVGILAQCSLGLHHAHELQSRDGRSLEVVHRDVSPGNIFVTTDGLAKMLDFGVAKARGASQKTRTGTVKGKNSYMSPEQILGKEVDRRSDVFSLGIVLWEALTSRRLFSRDTDFLTFTAITTTDIEDVCALREDVSESLGKVVSKALARDREERYATAKELAEALLAATGSTDEHFSEKAIGEYVSQRFSRELLPFDELSESIAKKMDSPLEGDEAGGNGTREDLILAAPSAKPASVTAPTLPEGALLAAPLAAPPLEGGLPSEPVAGERLPLAGERKRLVLAVAAAVVVTAVLAVLFMGGQDPAKEGVAVAESIDAGSVAPALLAPHEEVALAKGTDAGTVDAVDAGASARPRVVEKRPAYLTVDSSPYAVIYVDGKKVGVTPIFKLKLKAGKHKLKAVSATGAKQSLRLSLKPGRTKNLGRLKW